MKWPIELQAEMETMFRPLMREQLRGQLASHALQGLTAREEGHVSIEDEEDLAWQAVRMADLVLDRLEKTRR